MLFKIGIQNCQFSQQIYLRNNGRFAPNLSQNYATLYRHLFGGAQWVGKSDVSQLSKTSSLLGQMDNLETHWPIFLQPLIS